MFVVYTDLGVGVPSEDAERRQGGVEMDAVRRTQSIPSVTLYVVGAVVFVLKSNPILTALTGMGSWVR